ncbi:MAG: LTA synthase family protein [Oligoflexales bacterium]
MQERLYKSWLSAGRFWLLVSLLFLVHRLLTFPYLSDSADWVKTLESALVGTWSDLWVAWLVGALVFWVHLTTSRKVARGFDRAFLLFIGLVVAAHQSYVEFFGFQFILNHFKYLSDRAFIGANIRSLLEWRVLATAFVAAGLVAIYPRFRLKPVQSKTLPVAAALCVTILPVIGHSLNIHYRVQWFVPERLQTQVFERIYLQWKIQDNLTDYPKDEMNFLRSALGDKGSDLSPQSAVWRQVRDSGEMHPLAVQMRRELANTVQEGRRPLILVVLLESARPLEFGTFGFYGGESLTPNFDKLARESVLFKEAYSTGTVTRSGQEAAWCGYYSGFSNSLMRERPDLTLACLPSLLKNQVESFWFHGGKGEFDNQKTFWQSQGVQHFITGQSFAPDTPRSDWGVSDKALFQRSAEEITRLEGSAAKQPFLLGFVLSITNHIPWGVPSDSSETVKAAAAASEQPHFVTTMYTDDALGAFVDDLKQRGIWQDTLMIVSSDHGITKSAKSNYNSPNAGKKQLSHIVLSITGGVATKSLRALQMDQLEVKDFVSQADIAPFISYVTGNDTAAFMGEPLLSKRRMPVFSDVITDVYFPQEDSSISRRDKIEAPLASIPDNLKFAVSYYRAFLYSLFEMSVD